MSHPHVISTFRCARCRKVKQDTNYWFIVSILPENRIWCEPMELWLERHFRLGPDDKPLCGQLCALAEIDMWMTLLRNAKAKEAPQKEARPTAAPAPQPVPQYPETF